MPVAYRIVEETPALGRSIQTVSELEVGVELAPGFQAFEESKE